MKLYNGLGAEDIACLSWEYPTPVLILEVFTHLGHRYARVGLLNAAPPQTLDIPEECIMTLSEAQEEVYRLEAVLCAVKEDLQKLAHR